MRTISRSILLALAGCGLTALAAAPAVARTCPSGQFLQVSKGKCISKDSARKLGLASHGAAHAAAKPKPETAGETRVEKSAAAQAPEEKTAEERAPDRTADAAPTETTVASASPAFGASPSFGYASAQP